MALTFSLITTTLLLLTTITTAQTPPAPPPASDSCNGIFLSYTYTSGSKLPPERRSNQPYRFESTLRVLNNAAEELKSWRVFVGFQHDEYLVSASNAVIADGSATLPGPVGNGTVFSGFPTADLKTAIETAGDVNQMSIRVDFVGTQFGVGSPDVPMPTNISLVNDGFVCPRPTMQGTRVMNTCCIKDPNAVTNVTIEEFLPRQTGDLTIMYDVIRTYESNYWAEVTIENHNALGRLDNWNLTWDWMRDEFINDIKGAYPFTRDSSECIFGPQGTFYQQMDFSNVLNCERRPTLIDLPLEMTNNTQRGNIPFCCRNGTILPPSMDPAKSKSAFQLQVYKMPPDLNRSELIPPQNFKISGRLNPDYKCGPPVRVSPSEFPDPSGLPGSTAVSSWQVVCNITQAKDSSPRCCVSFSAYFNESIIPCPTCACGCPSSTSSRTCSTTAPAMFLPAQALLVPFENRTTLSTAWASLQHRTVPNPLPCGDHCGVSLNWHLLTDYRGGWSARVTLFNWDDTSFADWFVAVEMDKSAPGFEKAYSFNATALEYHGVNDTIFMQGLEGLNYLVGEVDGDNPKKDPRVPGKQQSVISFTKKLTPGINVAGGDGFPTKVFFNGEECALPRVLPTSNSDRRVSGLTSYGVLAFIILVMLM